MKGIVVSNKMMKSVTVMVERIYKHPRWGKYVRGRKKYMGTCADADGRVPKPEPPVVDHRSLRLFVPKCAPSTLSSTALFGTLHAPPVHVLTPSPPLHSARRARRVRGRGQSRAGAFAAAFEKQKVDRDGDTEKRTRVRPRRAESTEKGAREGFRGWGGGCDLVVGSGGGSGRNAK